jgi:hypothetical protein
MTIYKDIRYSDSISTLTAGDNISAGDPIIVSNSGLAIPANVKQQLPTTQTNLPWDINDYYAVIRVHPDGERVVVADDSVIYLKSKAQGGISDISMTDSTHTFNISEIQFASSTTFICFGSRNVTNDNTWAGYGVIAVTIDNNNVMTAGNWCVVDDYAAELGEYTELSQFKTMAVNGNKILVGFKARHPTSGETGLGLKTFLLSGATITYDTCAITTPWQIVVGPAHDIKKHVADDKFLMLALDGNNMTKLFVIDTTNGIVLSASQFVGSEYSGGGQYEVLRIILNQYDGYKFSVIHHAKPNSNSAFSENRIVSSQYTMTDNTIELTHNGDMILFQSTNAHEPNSLSQPYGENNTEVILTEDGKLVYGSGNGGTSRKARAHDGSTGKLFIFDLTTGAVEIITEADQISNGFGTSDKFLNDKTLICYDRNYDAPEFKAYLSPAHQSITSNMANGEMIGFAVNNASASEIVSINSTGSMLDGLSNLSLGQQYYLDTNGSLTTTETEIAVGKAITTSSMIVDINKTTVSSSGSSGSGSGVIVYDTLNDLPLSDNSVGEQAFVVANNSLYIYTTQGWFNIAVVNTTPVITQGPDAAYMFATDGTPTVITLVANDPEGMAITWSHSVTSGTLGNSATVSQADNVFTITPSTNSADEGTFDITFTASDGLNLAAATSSFTLSFFNALESLVMYGTNTAPHSWSGQGRAYYISKPLTMDGSISIQHPSNPGSAYYAIQFGATNIVDQNDPGFPYGNIWFEYSNGLVHSQQPWLQLSSSYPTVTQMESSGFATANSHGNFNGYTGLQCDVVWTVSGNTVTITIGGYYPQTLDLNCRLYLYVASSGTSDSRTCVINQTNPVFGFGNNAIGFDGTDIVGP